MATSALRISLLLVVLCATDGESSTSEDSHCVYTFNVPSNDCGQTPMEDQLAKSQLVALQNQVTLLAGRQEHQAAENSRLRQEVAALKRGNCENIFA